jgi:hypothetical protein
MTTGSRKKRWVGRLPPRRSPSLDLSFLDFFGNQSCVLKSAKPGFTAYGGRSARADASHKFPRLFQQSIQADRAVRFGF